MTSNVRQVMRNIKKDKLLDRELDFLPPKINRDDIREIGRKYGPRRRRSLPVRLVLGAMGFAARYGALFAGMIVGAEYAAVDALRPLVVKEEHWGDSLRFFLGEGMGQKAAETGKALELAGTLVAATPRIIVSALYGALIGIAAYYFASWVLVLCLSYKRRAVVSRKVSKLIA
jgi:hypothetical protein